MNLPHYRTQTAKWQHYEPEYRTAKKQARKRKRIFKCGRATATVLQVRYEHEIDDYADQYSGNYPPKDVREIKAP